MYSTMPAGVKPFIRFAVRQTLGRWPAPAGRLTGPLAVHGGTPVRDVRLRPWPTGTQGNLKRWHTKVRGEMRQIYVNGAEGSQHYAGEFASLWAEYCGCRYGLLFMHGTDALRIGLAAALDHDGLDHGGEIIVPNYSFIASVTAPLDRR
jgi:hypothetical protein